MSDPIQEDLSGIFNQSPEPAKKEKAKRPAPICVRVTEEERAQLEKEAGGAALSAYVRHRIFRNDTVDRPKRYLKKQRRPQIDSELVARLLGSLGASDMTKALFGLLLAAKSRELEVAPEISEKLERACSQIEEMRDILVLALNVRPRKDAGR
jgi:hypothetical protein